VWPEQRPFSLPPNQATRGHPAHPPRVNYTALATDKTPLSQLLLRFEDPLEIHGFSHDKVPMKGMELVKLHVSGDSSERVNLMFMADGCMCSCDTFEWELISDTADEKEKFVEDARKLTAVVVSETGAMSHVADLLNIWGVFVPSEHVSKMTIELTEVWDRDI
jgi:hypothetical protein